MTNQNKKIITQDEQDIVLDAKKGFFANIFTSVNKILLSDKKIGELNGKWATLFKTFLMLSFITFPTFLAWGTWVTKNTFEMCNHLEDTAHFNQRLTNFESNVKIIERMESQINRISDKVETLPPPEWRRRIEILETEYAKISTEMKALDKINAAEHSQMLILLESIKTKLDLLVKQ
jgi:hypothetical protein